MSIANFLLRLFFTICGFGIWGIGTLCFIAAFYGEYKP